MGTHRPSMIAHGLTTKFFPFVFMLITFFYILQFTTESISFIEPEDFYMGMTIIIGGGLIFVNSSPNSDRGQGQ